MKLENAFSNLLSVFSTPVCSPTNGSDERFGPYLVAGITSTAETSFSSEFCKIDHFSLLMHAKCLHKNETRYTCCTCSKTYFQLSATIVPSRKRNNASLRALRGIMPCQKKSSFRFPERYAYGAGERCRLLAAYRAYPMSRRFLVILTDNQRDEDMLPRELLQYGNKGCFCGSMHTVDNNKERLWIFLDVRKHMYPICGNVHAMTLHGTNAVP